VNRDFFRRAALHIKGRLGWMADIGKPGHNKEKHHAYQTGRQQTNNGNQFVISRFHNFSFGTSVPPVIFALAHPERDHQDEDYKRNRGHRKHHDGKVRVIKGLANRLILRIVRRRWEHRFSTEIGGSPQACGADQCK